MALSEAEKKVLRTIDSLKGEAVSFLSQLVRTSSDSGYEGAAQKIVEDKFRELGLGVDVFEADPSIVRSHPEYSPFLEGEEQYKGRPNVIGRYAGSGGGRSLIFMAHIDTVPPGPRSDWRHDPLGSEIDGAKLFGRGAMDMKGGLATFTMAVKAMALSGIKPRGDIFLWSTIEEEAGGSGGVLACILKGYRADGVINLHPDETSVDSITVEYSGALCFEVTVKGRMVHGYQAHLGINAIDKAIKICAALNDLDRHRAITVRSELIEKMYILNGKVARATNLYISHISAGQWDYLVPSLCTIKGTISFPPGETINGVIEMIEDCVGTACEADPWLKANPAELSWGGFKASTSKVEPDHPLVGAASEAISEIVGKKPQIIGKAVASDVRFPVVYGGIPTISIGPLGGGPHAADEWIDLESFHQYIKASTLLAMRWCG